MQHLHYQRLIHQNFVQSFPEEKWLNNLHHFTINFSFKLQVHTLEGLMHLPKNPKLEGLLVRCYAPVVHSDEAQGSWTEGRGSMS